MPKHDSQLALEQLWRDALATEGGKKIPCESKSHAVRIRYMLYNAVKWVKNPKPDELVDSKLTMAVHECSISIIGEKQNIVHVKRKMDDPAMQAILAAIGGVAPSAETLALQEQAQRVFDRLAAEQAEVSPAPVADSETPAPPVDKSLLYGARPQTKLGSMDFMINLQETPRKPDDAQ